MNASRPPETVVQISSVEHVGDVIDGHVRDLAGRFVFATRHMHVPASIRAKRATVAQGQRLLAAAGRARIRVYGTHLVLVLRGWQRPDGPTLEETHHAA